MRIRLLLALSVLSLVSGCRSFTPPTISSPISATNTSFWNAKVLSKLNLVSFKHPDLPSDPLRSLNTGSSSDSIGFLNNSNLIASGEVKIESYLEPSTSYLSYALTWLSNNKIINAFYGIDVKKQLFERFETSPEIGSLNTGWHKGQSFISTNDLFAIDIVQRRLTSVKNINGSELKVKGDYLYVIVDKTLLQINYKTGSERSFPISVKTASIGITAVSPDHSKVVLSISEEDKERLFGIFNHHESFKTATQPLLSDSFPAQFSYILDLNNGEISKLNSGNNGCILSCKHPQDIFSPNSNTYFFNGTNERATGPESGQIILLETASQKELLRLTGHEAKWVNASLILTLQNTSTKPLVKFNTLNPQNTQLISSIEIEGLSTLEDIHTINSSSNPVYKWMESEEVLYIFNLTNNKVLTLPKRKTVLDKEFASSNNQNSNTQFKTNTHEDPTPSPTPKVSTRKPSQFITLDQIWIEDTTQKIKALSIEPLLADSPTLVIYTIDLTNPSITLAESFSLPPSKQSTP